MILCMKTSMLIDHQHEFKHETGGFLLAGGFPQELFEASCQLLELTDGLCAREP